MNYHYFVYTTDVAKEFKKSWIIKRILYNFKCLQALRDPIIPLLESKRVVMKFTWDIRKIVIKEGWWFFNKWIGS